MTEFCTILVINLPVPLYGMDTCPGIYITTFIIMLCVYTHTHTHTHTHTRTPVYSL